MQSKWFDIFRLKRFNFVVVEINGNRERQKLSQKHRSSWDNEFFLVLPEGHEMETFQPSDFVKKYGMILKNFMASDDSRVLITDQVILGAIVKGEQKDNFFNFLIKRKKQIIVFSELGTSDLFSNYENQTYVMDENTFLQKTEIPNSSKIIKQRIAEVYSPFSNPVDTYEKMKKDGIHRIQ